MTKKLYLRQLYKYNVESFCNMWPCRRSTAIDNGPLPTIHDLSNNTFHLVEVNEFRGSEVFIIFDPICGGSDEFNRLDKHIDEHLGLDLVILRLRNADNKKAK